MALTTSAPRLSRLISGSPPQTRGNGDGETAPGQPDLGQFGQGRKGKGKAKADPELGELSFWGVNTKLTDRSAALDRAIENDEYDSETYEIDDDQSKRELSYTIENSKEYRLRTLSATHHIH
jgi:hypothetical protein